MCFMAAISGQHQRLDNAAKPVAAAVSFVTHLYFCISFPARLWNFSGPCKSSWGSHPAWKTCDGIARKDNP
jgi:hypothetical protein